MIKYNILIMKRYKNQNYQINNKKRIIIYQKFHKQVIKRRIKNRIIY